MMASSERILPNEPALGGDAIPPQFYAGQRSLAAPERDSGAATAVPPT
jgi:hypothetical protein